jgi:hypothetical protein
MLGEAFSGRMVATLSYGQVIIAVGAIDASVFASRVLGPYGRGEIAISLQFNRSRAEVASRLRKMLDSVIARRPRG